MPSKTSVEGTKVRIDDCTYDVQPAGDKRWAVYDEFGAALGYFMLRGKVVEPDDFQNQEGLGVSSGHSVRTIAKVYRDHLAGLPKQRPTSRMVCQIVTYDAIDDDALDKALEYVTWLKTQPGCKAALFARDPETKKGKSVRVFSTLGHLNGALGRTPPEEAVDPPGGSVEVIAMAKDL